MHMAYASRVSFINRSHIILHSIHDVLISFQNSHKKITKGPTWKACTAQFHSKVTLAVGQLCFSSRSCLSPLFTTLVRVFAREGRIDALSLLNEMKSNSFDADLVLYNVCIDCFGKVYKVVMAWKFFHEMKAQGLLPDNVTYTSMIGVLCKVERLDEAVELFDLNRSVPCVYAYNTMIMGYGSVGKFDEAYSLLERQKGKECIPSVIAYNCLLTCLGRKGKVEEALRT